MGFTKLVAAFLLVNAALVFGENEFRNYRLIRILPRTEKQIELVKSWQHNTDYDIWNVKESFVDVALSPVAYESYSNILSENSIDFEILNNDIQRNVDEEAQSLRLLTLRNMLKGDTSLHSRVVNTFAKHSDINSWLDTVANGQEITTYSIGKTLENRNLKVIKFSRPSNTKKIWIDCGIHAREWISPATCVYMIDKFNKEYSTNADVKRVLDKYELHILPVHNPDGYDYSFTSGNRMWRKNRNKNSGSSCIGVDLNRNFGYKWMVAGASNNPCSDTFAGPTPDSELETKAVEAAINANSGQWAAFFTIHTYGNYWFTPWGYTSALPSDYSDLVAKSQVGVNAIYAVNGLRFALGSSTNLLYAAAGGSDDWAKGVAGIKYSHCLELRPGSSGQDSFYGFQLPVDRVPLAGQETYKGIVAFLDNL